MGVKETFGYNSFRTEDRWLWFTIRLSLVLFMIGIQVVVVIAFAKLMIAI